jgi:hypothetical protein
MKLISLGGVGGCNLAFALRKLNQPTYPYNWLITTQSFVIDSFLKFENFFEIDEEYLHGKQTLLNKNRTAIMLHDFKKFDKKEVTDKFKRRYSRLKDAMQSSEGVLFIRAMEDLEAPMIPNGEYDDIFKREKDEIHLWDKFLNEQQNKFNKEIKMLLLAHNEKLVKPTNNPNLFVEYVEKTYGNRRQERPNVGRIVKKIKEYL